MLELTARWRSRTDECRIHNGLRKRPPRLRDSDDDDGDPRDLNPTIDDCVRLWHQAIEWIKHDTIIGIRELAAQAAGWEEADRDMWIDSVQRVRANGLFDADTAYNLLHHIVEEAVMYDAYAIDEELQEIGDRMEALCDLYGLPEGTDFTPWRDPPAEWTALVRECEAREQGMEYEVLRAAGEHEMVRVMIEERAEFDRRIKVVENRIRRDHSAERERWDPLTERDVERLSLEQLD
jgi:hypothetical protein